MRTPLYFAGLLLPFCITGMPAYAQRGGDVQAQILYAYQTEDRNQLSNVIQTLATQLQGGATDSALRYHLAHADYRQGLLAVDARRAEPAFDACIEQLKPLVEQDADAVEALSLQSACYSNLARFRRLESVLLRSRAAERLNLAFKLAPRNPRVLYLTAMDALARSKSGSVEGERAFAQLQAAAQCFEQSSATRIDVPGWGHAEAYLALGKQLELRGDILGARNWIEKSLIAAPDYKAAQLQIATLVQR